jgi:hypothetical protein
MTLKFYSNYPFVPGNEIYQVDLYTGTGSTSTFNLKNLVASKVGNTIQFDNVVYQRYLNGYTFPSNTSFTLSSTPPANSQGIVPGTQSLLFSVFDALNVPGQPVPSNQNAQTFYLADDGQSTSNIIVNEYVPVSGNPGIAILFQNMVTAAGASTTFLALACANVNGTAMSYQATGTTLYTAPYYAITALSASAASLGTTITVNSVTGFYPGDFIFINPGNGTQENPQITGISGNTLTVSGLNYTHSANELVVMNGRQFWANCTLPVGILNGVTNSYINICLIVDCLQQSR